jgi:hypothetical protein
MNEIQEEEPLDRRRERFLRDFFENSELYTFGIITQTGYNELKNKIQKMAEKNEARLHRWLVLGLAAFVIVGLSSTAAIVGLTILLGKQKHVTTEIQAQRKDTIRKNCQDQNKRHDRTLARLDTAEKNAEKHAKTLRRKMKIRNNTEISIGLIDALAPRQNCKAVVRRATR